MAAGRVPTPIRHGERRGAVKERRRGLPVCEKCKAAERQYNRDQYEKRKKNR